MQIILLCIFREIYTFAENLPRVICTCDFYLFPIHQQERYVVSFWLNLHVLFYAHSKYNVIAYIMMKQDSQKVAGRPYT